VKDAYVRLLAAMEVLGSLELFRQAVTKAGTGTGSVAEVVWRELDADVAGRVLTAAVAVRAVAGVLVVAAKVLSIATSAASVTVQASRAIGLFGRTMLRRTTTPSMSALLLRNSL
jgi:hypothetical protein